MMNAVNCYVELHGYGYVAAELNQPPPLDWLSAVAVNGVSVMNLAFGFQTGKINKASIHSTWIPETAAPATDATLIPTRTQPHQSILPPTWRLLRTVDLLYTVIH